MVFICASVISPRSRSEDDDELTSGSVRQTSVNGSYQPFCPAQATGHLQRIISIEEDHLPSLLDDCQVQTTLQECNEGQEASDNEENPDLVMNNIHQHASSALHQQSVEMIETPTSPRGQPVGKENSMNVSMQTLTDTE